MYCGPLAASRAVRARHPERSITGRIDRDHVEAAAVVRAVLGGGLGRVDLQQDEHGFYLSSADTRGDQKKSACPCPREKPFLL